MLLQELHQSTGIQYTPGFNLSSQVQPSAQKWMKCVIFDFNLEPGRNKNNSAYKRYEQWHGSSPWSASMFLLLLHNQVSCCIISGLHSISLFCWDSVQKISPGATQQYMSSIFLLSPTSSLFIVLLYPIGAQQSILISIL